MLTLYITMHGSKKVKLLRIQLAKQLSFKKELHELEYVLICRISTGNTIFCCL